MFGCGTASRGDYYLGGGLNYFLSFISKDMFNSGFFVQYVFVGEDFLH